MSTIERNQEGTLQFVPGIDYRNLREALVRSFVMQHRAGLICKPSSHKWDLALVRVQDRVEMESYWSLIVRPTLLTTLREGREKDLGMGLFAGINYRTGAKIVYFRGNLVTKTEFDAQRNHAYLRAIRNVVADDELYYDCGNEYAFSP